MNNNLPVIPLRIENVNPTGALEYFIGSVHWLDALTEPLDQHLERLADNVQRLIGPDARPSVSARAASPIQPSRPRDAEQAVAQFVPVEEAAPVGAPAEPKDSPKPAEKPVLSEASPVLSRAPSAAGPASPTKFAQSVQAQIKLLMERERRMGLVLSLVGTIAILVVIGFIVKRSNDISRPSKAKLEELLEGFDSPNFTLAHTLTGPANSIRSIAFSADGRFLASGSDDDTLRIWSVDSGLQVGAWEIGLGGINPVTSAAFSPDGKMLAFGALDGLRIWSVPTMTQNTDSSIQSVGVNDGKVNSDIVVSVAFSDDGRLVADADVSGKIRIIDINNKREVRSLIGHGNPCPIAFRPGGNVLAFWGANDSADVTDVTTGEVLRVFPYRTPDLQSLAFSPDGKLLAIAAGREIKLWDVTTGRVLSTLAGHAATVKSLAFSPDGASVASGSEDKDVKLWDVATGRELFTLTGHKKGVEAVAFSRDGGAFASASDDETIKLWRVPGQK